MAVKECDKIWKIAVKFGHGCECLKFVCVLSERKTVSKMIMNKL